MNDDYMYFENILKSFPKYIYIYILYFLESIKLKYDSHIQQAVILMLEWISMVMTCKETSTYIHGWIIDSKQQ